MIYWAQIGHVHLCAGVDKITATINKVAVMVIFFIKAF